MSKHQSKNKDNEAFINELHRVHGNLYEVLEPYNGLFTEIDVVCTECQCTFKCSPFELLEGRGCIPCSVRRVRHWFLTGGDD